MTHLPLRIAVTAATAVVAALLPTPAATAAPTAPPGTTCVGTADAVTVDGDLVVPAGRACLLDGTTVAGTVRVQRGADLLVVDGTLRGEVVVQPDGFLHLRDSTVGGLVRANSAFGVHAEESRLTGGFTGRAVDGSATQPLFWAVGGRIGSSVTVRAGGLHLEGTRVSGNVAGLGATYTDVLDTTVAGSLQVRENRRGSVVCASEVDGDARFTGNAGVVQLGADGPVLPCSGPTVWGGDVTVDDSRGPVVVADSVVRGDLTGTGNQSAPTGEGNRVRGRLVGQLAALGAGSQVAMESGPRALAAPGGDDTADQADEAVRESLEQRRLAAGEDAAAAGGAF